MFPVGMARKAVYMLPGHRFPALPLKVPPRGAARSAGRASRRLLLDGLIAAALPILCAALPANPASGATATGFFVENWGRSFFRR